MIIPMKIIDKLSMAIPLVDFERLDVRHPGFVRVLVDSETAQKMLNLNVRNRRQRRAAVEYLKHQILNGEWREDHPQPVVFSDLGRLIDGQHRLQAIVESNLDGARAVIMRVETGARDDVREYLDTGVPRSLDDRVELVDDMVYNKTISELCAFDLQVYRKSHVRPSPDDARIFLEKHPESSLYIAKTRKRQQGTVKVAVAYAAMQYYEISREKAELFYPAVFTPDSGVQQARMLRDFLLRSKKTLIALQNASSFRSEVYARAVYCMKAHRDGKLITRINKASW